MNIYDYRNAVFELGCIIDGCDAPPNLHHPRVGLGMAQKSSDWLVIPLCKYHHLDGPFGHAIHNGIREFEKNYMSEMDLLAETIKKMMR